MTDSAGQLAGDGIGSIDYQTGRFRLSPTLLPAPGTVFSVALADAAAGTSGPITLTDGGSVLTGSLAAGVAAGSLYLTVTVQHSFASELYDAPASDTYTLVDEAGLRFRLSTLNTDVTVPVRVVRGGKELVVNVKLAAPPENPPRDKAQLDGRQPLSGATVVNMSPAVAGQLGTDARLLRHRGLAGTAAPLEGVQFHPESILTERGHDLLRNFLEQSRQAA